MAAPFNSFDHSGSNSFLHSGFNARGGGGPCDDTGFPTTLPLSASLVVSGSGAPWDGTRTPTFALQGTPPNNILAFQSIIAIQPPANYSISIARFNAANGCSKWGASFSGNNSNGTGSIFSQSFTWTAEKLDASTWKLTFSGFVTSTYNPGNNPVVQPVTDATAKMELTIGF